MSWNSLAELQLTGERVALRPLRLDDQHQLAQIAFDDSIWRYFVTAITGDADLERYLNAAVDDTRAGRRAVYAVIDRESGRMAGSMAYGNLAPTDGRLEIGWSWLGKPYQRTGLNRAAKLLLLDHAFNRLGARAQQRFHQSRGKLFRHCH